MPRQKPRQNSASEEPDHAGDGDDDPADAARLQQDEVHLVDFLRHLDDVGLDVRGPLLEDGETFNRGRAAHVVRHLPRR